MSERAFQVCDCCKTAPAIAAKYCDDCGMAHEARRDELERLRNAVEWYRAVLRQVVRMPTAGAVSARSMQAVAEAALRSGEIDL